MRIIYYLYYKVYKYYESEDLSPIFSTFCYFSLVSFAFFFIFNEFIQYFFGIDLYIPLNVDKWTEGLIYFLIYLIPCYFLFVYNAKHKKILKMFNDTGKPQKRLHNIIIFWSGMFCLFLTLATAELIYLLKHHKF